MESHRKAMGKRKKTNNQTGADLFAECDKLTAIDLFAGCGGLSHGLEKAKFKTIGFTEIAKDAARTFILNQEHLMEDEELKKFAELEHVQSRFQFIRP